jgi:hypothetical protein
MITNNNALNFIDIGKFVGSLNLGIVHNIADPVIIDRNAIIIIGLMILISSFEDA